MKIRIDITLKKGVLDPQGMAINNSLLDLGFENVENVRQGKLIEVDISGTKQEALKTADDICQKLLVNHVIENYQISEI